MLPSGSQRETGQAHVEFGYLYWKRGLEAAMLAHMSAHLVMQIPGVMLLKTMLQQG